MWKLRSPHSSPRKGDWDKGSRRSATSSSKRDKPVNVTDVAAGIESSLSKEQEGAGLGMVADKVEILRGLLHEDVREAAILVDHPAMSLLCQKLSPVVVSTIPHLCFIFKCIAELETENSLRTVTVFLSAITNVHLDRQGELSLISLLLCTVSASGTVVAASTADCLFNGKDIPLLDLLLNCVHSETVGSPARSGLLQMIGIMNRCSRLEQAIIDSSFCTIIASGLGAQYNQLVQSTKEFTEEKGTRSPQFREALDKVLEYLVFWQNSLAQSESKQLNDKLLAYFDVLFVRQLLYPSIEPVSRTDKRLGPMLIGFRRVLSHVTNPPLVKSSGAEQELATVILSYYTDHDASRQSHQTASELSDLVSPDTPKLRPLIEYYLEAQDDPVVITVTLQIASIVVTSWSSTDCRANESSSRLAKLVKQLASIRTALDAEGDIGEYEQDIQRTLLSDQWNKGPLKTLQFGSLKHKLLSMMQAFYTNDPAVNLALTEVVRDLALKSINWLPCVIPIIEDLCKTYQDFCTDSFRNDIQKLMSRIKEQGGLQQQVHTLHDPKYANVVILREFVKELEALVVCRMWLPLTTKQG